MPNPKAAKKPAPKSASSSKKVTYGDGTAGDPWVLKTPSLTSEYQAWRDEEADPPALVVQVGTTRLSYQLRAIDHADVKREAESRRAKE